MFEYTVENEFHRDIGTFNTQNKAAKFAVTYMEDLYDSEKNEIDKRLIHEDLKKLYAFYGSIGTKYAPKPDKFYFGKYVSILVRKV